MKRRLKSEEEETIQHIEDHPEDYPPPQIPSIPLLKPTMSSQRKVRTIQRYISALEYNFTGQQFVSLRRDKGMKHLVVTAKAIIRQSLPIQCVEGLFLAVYFTNGMELLRIPISFTTMVDGELFHHIVLGIQHKRKWGAMGIIRLSKLMYKPMKFDTLNDLIHEFVKCYNSYYHSVVSIDLGLPFSHNSVSESPLQWKFVQIKIDESHRNWSDYKEPFIQYSRDCLLIFEHFEKSGKIPKWCTKTYREGFITAKNRR